MADLRLRKVLRHRTTCDGFRTECGYKIIVDDSDRSAIPVEIDDC
jgi:hypothetical protein